MLRILLFNKKVLNYPKNQGLETVLGTGSGTLKNPKFCRVTGTGSEWNPKFEKGFQYRFLGTLNFEKCSGPTGTGTGSGTLKNPTFCRVPGTAFGRNPKFNKRVPEPVTWNPKF
jgi:hypothetical protein